jgi:hypothetical protein
LPLKIEAWLHFDETQMAQFHWIKEWQALSHRLFEYGFERATIKPAHPSAHSLQPKKLQWRH